MWLMMAVLKISYELGVKCTPSSSIDKEGRLISGMYGSLRSVMYLASAWVMYVAAVL